MKGEIDHHSNTIVVSLTTLVRRIEKLTRVICCHLLKVVLHSVHLSCTCTAHKYILKDIWYSHLVDLIHMEPEQGHKVNVGCLIAHSVLCAKIC